MQHPLLNTQSTTPVASAAYHHTYASLAKLRAPAEAVGSDNAGVDPAADVVLTSLVRLDVQATTPAGHGTRPLSVGVAGAK
jgi:hypothetical protein